MSEMQLMGDQQLFAVSWKGTSDEEFDKLGTRPLGTIEMPWRDFANLPSNINQRDTDRRMHKRDTINALSEFCFTHAKVVAAYLDGVLYKVQGHTRSAFWLRGGVKDFPPDLIVSVELYVCRDAKALRMLHNTYDSPGAGARAQDKVHGALMANGIVLQSSFLKRKEFSEAIKCLADQLGFKGFGLRKDPNHIYDLITYFKPEIILFDSTMPQKGHYNTAFTLAALLTFLTDGGEALDFWEDYNSDAGIKDGNRQDKIQSLAQVYNDMVLHKKTSSTYYVETLGRILACYERQAGVLFSGSLVRAMSDSAREEFVSQAYDAKVARDGPFNPD